MSLVPRQWGGRPVWAEVDLDAIAHNLRLLAARAAPARVYAVVKANAYGHGAVAVARAALEAGAAALAVVCVDEAEELRRAAVTAPILVLGHTPASDADRVVALGLQPAVGGLPLVEALSAAAAPRGALVPIHLEVETGFNRHGLAPDDLVALAERARALPGVRVQALFTHFASADEEDQGFTRGQFDLLRVASARLPWVAERHCSASAGVLLAPDLQVEAVRPGISLYGYHPAQGWAPRVDLRPALALRSRLVRVSQLAPGATVGYGRTWTAPRPSRIALAMCGYADGYRRGFGNRAQALVRGRRAPVVGRVAMDMCTLDVTEIPGASEGDVATFLGADGAERVDADELAALADTISYEIVAGIAARVPRLYLRGGQAVEATTLVERAPRPLG
ncbi:MAG TPA: alanine racemase [Anaeromyxobacter sp.]|nr:alanine racemase [Anaeromyxobacter sp.]